MRLESFSGQDIEITTCSCWKVAKWEANLSHEKTTRRCNSDRRFIEKDRPFTISILHINTSLLMFTVQDRKFHFTLFQMHLFLYVCPVHDWNSASDKSIAGRGRFSWRLPRWTAGQVDVHYCNCCGLLHCIYDHLSKSLKQVCVLQKHQVLWNCLILVWIQSGSSKSSQLPLLSQIRFWLNHQAACLLIKLWRTAVRPRGHH